MRAPDTGEEEQKISFQVDFDNHDLKLLVLRADSDAEVIVDYHKVRKAILAEYGYTAASFEGVRLHILNFYPKGPPIPIMTHRNYSYIVRSMLQRDRHFIHLKMTQKGDLAKKKKRGEADV